MVRQINSAALSLNKSDGRLGVTIAERIDHVAFGEIVDCDRVRLTNRKLHEGRLLHRHEVLGDIGRFLIGETKAGHGSGFVVVLRILDPVVDPGWMRLRSRPGEVEAEVALQWEIIAMGQARFAIRIRDGLRREMTAQAADIFDELLAAAGVATAR